MKITVLQLRKIIREEVERVKEARQPPPWMVEPFKHPAKPPVAPKCEECGKKLTPQDKESYEIEGGEGYPRVCERCAEQP